jgi:hypothetical protein
MLLASAITTLRVLLRPGVSLDCSRAHQSREFYTSCAENLKKEREISLTFLPGTLLSQESA